MKKWMIGCSILILLTILLTGCVESQKQVLDENMKNTTKKEIKLSGKTKTAVFAGGCFWCMEAAFEKTPGVIESVSGFTGGKSKNPTYNEVVSGETSHYEAVQVTYDPEHLNYQDLVQVFWSNIDPVDDEGQFSDKGSQYKTAIFFENKEQEQIAKESKMELEKELGQKVVTQILPLGEFYKAEEYHQDYYKKSSVRYNLYKQGSGRPSRLKEISEMRNKNTQNTGEKDISTLTKNQYHITQENGTEPAFDNEYWDNKEEGIYVDIISGKPLFSSSDKFVSGTGWPSFNKSIDKEIILREDTSLGMKRTEVRSSTSHLGHLFNDGPNGGPRYCINSAALKFIPKKDLKKEGYEHYLKLFE